MILKTLLIGDLLCEVVVRRVSCVILATGDDMQD